MNSTYVLTPQLVISLAWKQLAKQFDLDTGEVQLVSQASDLSCELSCLLGKSSLVRVQLVAQAGLSLLQLHTNGSHPGLSSISALAMCCMITCCTN